MVLGAWVILLATVAVLVPAYAVNCTLMVLMMAILDELLTDDTCHLRMTVLMLVINSGEMVQVVVKW